MNTAKVLGLEIQRELLALADVIYNFRVNNAANSAR
jgi:hypothetical protein